MVIFTMGEVLCFVIGDVLIGEIAPEHARGAYYGASGFAALGQSFCAWFGGFLLHALGYEQGPVLFGILMVFTFLAFPFFYQGQRTRERLEKNKPTRHTAA
jgi:MFS family permease